MPDILVTVIKNTNRLCGGEVAQRLVKVSWEMASDRTKRNALLKMSGFLVKEVELLPRLLKKADDMDDLAKFFVKYGDEGSTLLKKFGDDLADEAFEVYKKKGNLQETIGIVRNRPITETIWLEKGTSKAGWQHIIERHPISEWQSRFPGISSENELQIELLKISEQIPRGSIGNKVTFTINGGPVSIVTGSNGFIVTAFPGQ